jgi:hypothetical protein
MMNFKNKLLLLIDKEIDYNIKRNIKIYTDIYNEEQLQYMLNCPTGLKLNDNMFLFYTTGIGFSCIMNDKNDKNPLCVVIERFLNDKKNIEII